MKLERSLYDVLLQTTQLKPANNALLFKNKYIKYKKLLKRVDRFASYLANSGIQKGDVITICLANIPQAVYAFYAINKIGAIAHFVHPLTELIQLESNLETTKSKIVIILDTDYLKFKSLLDKDISLISCCPPDELSLFFKVAYKFINRKKLIADKRIIDFKKTLKSRYPVSNINHDYSTSAIYLNSGGTSGKAKTIELSPYSLNAVASNAFEIIGHDSDINKLHMFSVLPMFHGFGMCMGIHTLICFGGCNTLMPKFNSSETIKLIKKNRLNILIGVPTLYEALLRNNDFAGKHLENIKSAFIGGDFVSLSLIDRFNREMILSNSKARLYEGYGLTETVTVCCVNTLYHNKPQTVGRPLKNVKIAIHDLESKKELKANEFGEIYVSGQTLMNGYLKDKEATDNTIYVDKNGVSWIKTGDYGCLDEDGFLIFKQRIKRMIKVSGIPVFPSEIETLVCSIPEVFEVCAFEIPDEKLTNAICLAVVLDRRFHEHIDEEIKVRIKNELGIYAVPKKIIYLDKMPKTVVGKIDVNEIKKVAAI